MRRFVKSLPDRALLASALICPAGLLTTVLAFWPGIVFFDAVSQYNQAVTHSYSTWHPVIMAAWWSMLDRVYAGSAPMLLFQLCLYWGAWFLLAEALRQTSPAVCLDDMFARLCAMAHSLFRSYYERHGACRLVGFCVRFGFSCLRSRRSAWSLRRNDCIPMLCLWSLGAAKHAARIASPLGIGHFHTISSRFLATAFPWHVRACGSDSRVGASAGSLRAREERQCFQGRFYLRHCRNCRCAAARMSCPIVYGRILNTHGRKSLIITFLGLLFR